MQFDPDKVTFFARTDARGKNIPFGIKAKDRQRHVYVIGKTGMGKSTLLQNMAVQDIQNGEGMAFIDPHGSAAETLLNYIPQERINDVLYFAPSDMEYPISFNIMEDVGPDKRHLVVSGLMSVFEKIWVDAWSARMAYILQNTLMALLEYPGSTLLGVNRMLSDKEYRKRVVDNVKDPGVRSFWIDEFAKYNERYMQEAGDAIKNKIGQFTANPVIRNIVGQPKSSFDIRKIMDEKKIIIMNLSKGLIGETNANLLGSMLTTRIYLAAMSRADLSPEKMRTMPNFYFYVDEFQSFANATFANILSEARKYHLNLTIAHQYIEQMEEEVRNAVFGNVGTIIAFRVGPFDAEVLETIFTPEFTAADIVNLGFAQIYLTLMIDGIGSKPFSATTLPAIDPSTISCKDMVIAASRRQFARERGAVELEIQKFHEPIVPPKAQRENVIRPPLGESREKKNPSAGEREPLPGGARRATTEGWNGVERRKSPPDRRQRDAQRDTEDQHTQKANDHRMSREKRQKVSSGGSSVMEKNSTSAISKTHVEDLRSILRRVVETEASKEKNVTTDESAAEVHSSVRTHEDLHNTSADSISADQNPTTSEVLSPVAPQASQETVVSHADAESNKIPDATSAVTKPPVTPKELERMMRVTTNDKPPF